MTAPTLSTPETITIPVNDIVIPANFRKSKPSKVAEIADSLERDGLLQPIGVRKADVGPALSGYVLVFGGHRLAAHKRLKRKDIECRLLDITAAQAESAMIAENLFRNPLKSAEYIRSLKRWQELFAVEHPVPRKAGRQAAPKEAGGIVLSPDMIPPIPGPRFDEVVSSTLGVSTSKIRGDAKAARILSDPDIDILEARGIGVQDIKAIASIKAQDSRQKAVSLVASGMEPKTAIAFATAPENATLTEVVQADEPSYRPESEYTDEEWLLHFCADALGRLEFQAPFKADAILWRRTRDALGDLRKKVMAVLKKPTTQARAPYRFRLTSILNILHPNEWPRCGPCNGKGGDCQSCHGMGYTVKTGGK